MQFIKQLLPLFIIALLFTSCNDAAQENITKKIAENAVDNSQVAENPKLNDTQKKNILFFGDSLTAGYGLEDELAMAYPQIIQEKIDSLALPYRVINAGLSGETTATGANRIGWVLKQKVDIFVLELGGNDALRGVKPDETHKNLQVILDKVKEKYPDAKVIVAGMEAPPSMGSIYTTEFRAVFKDIADNNEVVLIPFLLEKVGGIAELNQPDGIHPTEKGHRLVAETVWQYVAPILKGA
ncbi:MAG: arylesterase [Chitinophagales bacterium]